MKKIALILTAIMLQSCSSNQPSYLQRQHTAALKEHVFISDMEQYGVADKWVESLTGDCEDFALYMRRKLGGHLLFVRANTGELHVVLNVRGMIIDNLSSTVYPLAAMPHRLLFTMTEQHISQFKSRGQEQTTLEDKAENANP